MKTNSKPKSSFARTGAMVVGVLAAAALGGAVTFGMLSYSQRSAGAEPAIPSGVNLASWFDNGAGGQHLLRMFRGSAPPVGTQVIGTVMTDTNCDPDPEGLSHCHNIIDLGNGRRIEIVNTHIMSRHPCLSPGQRLSITAFSKDWIIASEGRATRTY